MTGEPLISVYTQVYNTKESDLRQCIESVLAQSYTNFEYIILDNGSTDGSAEVLQEYAQRDYRIKLTRLELNCPSWRFSDVQNQVAGAYFTCLDSDDWWEPSYLERMLEFLLKNHLDLALTGTIMYFEASGQHKIMRKLDQPVVLTQTQFAQQYQNYWVFPSTLWACLLPMGIIEQTDTLEVLQNKYAYGGDTMLMLRYLENCRRIGIDDSAMYHYRIHPDSASYQYNPRRFEANLAYCQQIRTFLMRHHAFDAQKQEWLKRVYLAAVTESIRLIMGERNTLHDKLMLCGEIAAHPYTADAMQSLSNEQTIFLEILRQFSGVVIQRGTESDLDELPPVLRLVCPRCGPGVSGELLKLCRKDEGLQQLLLQDDLTALALDLGERIVRGSYAGQFDLPAILAGLLPGNPLSTVRDAKFYQAYPDLCVDMIRGDNINALDKMTETLMDQSVSYGRETYLQLYLTLAALEQQVPAFLFGKVQLAQYYLERKDYAPCQGVLQELAEMGMEEQEDVTRIKAALEEITPAT